jgi:predicted amidohydrolase YtcJ
MIMPSFFEGHCHAQSQTSQVFACTLTGSTLEEYLKTIEDFMTAHPEVTVVKGSGWSNALFSPTGPKKEDLDKICSRLEMDIPIALSSFDYHSLWVNSKALEMAGITKETKNPYGGVIERDEITGEPSGTLREGPAEHLVQDILQDHSIEQYKEGIKSYQAMAHSLGFNGSFDAVLVEGSNAIKAYKALGDNGELKMYFRGTYLASPEQDFDSQIASFVNARKNDDSDLFKMTHVKFFEDGVIGAGTAYLKEPYATEIKKGNPTFRGVPIWELDKLQDAFDKTEDAGFQIHVHAIGDAAVSETLDALAHAEKQNGKKDYRNAITHCTLVDPSDFARFKQLGVIAVPNPYWAVKVDPYFKRMILYLGEKRAESEYPIKSFFSHGVMVSTASDYPITPDCNPFDAIQVGITRTAHGIPGLTDPEPLWPEESATLEEMIRSVTYNGAYAYFLENETGSIEVGKSADMIVIDQNLFNIPVTDISKTKVLMTFFKGKEVYKRTS